MINIKDFQHAKLSIKKWQVVNDQSWCILGKNGAGKQYLDQLFTGELKDPLAQICQLPSAEKVGLVSFEKQQAIYEHELKIDRSDYINAYDIGTKAREFLPCDRITDPLIETFGLSHCLEHGYRQLSTGEGRKLLILQAIFNGVELLVCDNPFDSLDRESCHALSNALQGLSSQGISVLLLLSNRFDIPDWCQNVAFIERGRLDVIGKLESEETQRKIDTLLATEPDNVEWPEQLNRLESFQQPFLVQLNNGTVHYNGVNVFENLNVSIEPLQHTLLTGRNGSGKSTLVQLITGDCPQCYSNDLQVLGFKRGSGESIWQLKKQMGIVSSELHRQYRVNGELLTVVLSGFYDSIGLYQQPEKKHVTIAKQWIAKIGLEQHQHSLFQSLSYGEQRLALIARALVKSPYLLILDEPTQGLDELNRHRVLNFLKHLVQQNRSTVLFVSHREDEYLPLFKQKITL